MNSTKIKRVYKHMLTEKDKQFLKDYRKLWKAYLILSIFTILVLTFQNVFLFKREIPKLIQLIQEHYLSPEYIKQILIRVSGHYFIWVIILIGLLVGTFYTYRRVVIILDKLKT